MKNAQKKLDNASEVARDIFYRWEIILDDWEIATIKEKQTILDIFYSELDILKSLIGALELQKRRWVVYSKVMKWKDIHSAIEYFQED